MKGCILQKSDYIFSTGNFEEDKKIKEAKEPKEEIDFATLARSN